MSHLTDKPECIIDEPRLLETVDFLKQQYSPMPKVAAILGSGLGAFAETAKNSIIVPTNTIPGYPPSTVPDHAVGLVFGEVAEKKVLLLQGRGHCYEGYSIRRVAFPVHLFVELGIEKLIITNAAGSVNPLFQRGDLMLIDDHINFMLDNPLRGQHKRKWGPRWPDMSEPYSRSLQGVALRVAAALQIRLRRGVLLASKGPSYETAAEVQMARQISADALTMSTVPEVIATVYRRLQVLGISCITNLATGLSSQKLDHAEVTETANRVSETFARLMQGIVKEIG